MDFINEQVHQLPAVEDLEWIPVEEDYLKVLRIQWMLGIVALAVIAAGAMYMFPVFKNSAGGVALMVAWFITSLSWYIIMKESFKRKAYAIRTHDITYRSGWIMGTIRTVPFSRVQHSNVVSGPLDRKFGLATLIIYTAGTGSADVKIPGLTGQKAEEIKEWINKRIADASGA